MFNFASPINSLGYGYAGLNIVKAAYHRNISLAWHPVGQFSPTDIPPGDIDIVMKARERGLFFDPKMPSVRMYHQFDLGLHCGSPRIGFPFFELDKFNEVELHHLRNQDAICVASEWAKGIIIKNGIDVPTWVAPLGVDRDIFHEVQQKQRIDETVFFNVGKWEIRKGHDVIIEAFERAFTLTDKVKLIMICSNPFLTAEEQEEWVSRYRNSPLGGKIEIVPHRLKSQQQIANAMQRCDVGVFPARGEGWNLDLLEAMSCGKQVIATNCSAHTEFCTPQNAMLVDVPDMELAYDGKWFSGQGRWGKLGEPQIEQIAEHMRIAHKAKQSDTLGVNNAGIETAKHFSWENTVNKLALAVEGSR